MSTWVVCPKCFTAFQGIPGKPCAECGTPTLKAPLMRIEPSISKDSRTRLCPNCHIRNALHSYPGGFKSCAQQECKNAALDLAMEAE